MSTNTKNRNSEADAKAPGAVVAPQTFWEVWFWFWLTPIIVGLWIKVTRALKYLTVLFLVAVFVYILSFIGVLSLPSVPSFHLPSVPSFHLPSAPSFHLPSIPSIRPPFFSKSRTATRRAPPKAGDVKVEGVDCLTPTVVFQQWDINTIVPGPDGYPLPVEYTLNIEKAHKLSVVDIDAMDMQMAIYVDDELRGLTSDFVLDKTNNCGDSLRACGTGGFSAGVVVVAPGKHTVKIEWAGKEFVEGIHDMDWGEEKSRRFKWKKESCA